MFYFAKVKGEVCLSEHMNLPVKMVIASGFFDDCVTLDKPGRSETEMEIQFAFSS